MIKYKWMIFYHLVVAIWATLYLILLYAPILLLMMTSQSWLHYQGFTSLSLDFLITSGFLRLNFFKLKFDTMIWIDTYRLCDTIKKLPVQHPASGRQKNRGTVSGWHLERYRSFQSHIHPESLVHLLFSCGWPVT